MTQFNGENNWDAIVNDNSLDIEEERSFEDFIKDLHYSKDETLEVLEYLFGMWRRSLAA